MNKYPQPGQNGDNDRNGTQRNGKQKEKFIRTNWKIKAYECRLIEEGKEPRIMPTKNALEYAQGLGLDLVELGYDYRTGVSTCRICDYGKYVYDQKQKEKQAKKQARANQADLKCLQISLTIDTADLERVVSRAREFLEDGDRVKLALRFRGRRELANANLGRDMMKKILTGFDDIAVIDSAPVLNGKELSCILRKGQPKKQKPVPANPGAIRITVS